MVLRLKQLYYHSTRNVYVLIILTEFRVASSVLSKELPLAGTLRNVKRIILARIFINKTRKKIFYIGFKESCS
jgi:hypothetical protein